MKFILAFLAVFGLAFIWTEVLGLVGVPLFICSAIGGIVIGMITANIKEK